MMERINDLRLICGDPALPGDLKEIPQARSLVDIQVQRLQAGGYQGSIFCDGHQVWFGHAWPTFDQAWAHAEANETNILQTVTDGLLEDIGRHDSQ